MSEFQDDLIVKESETVVLLEHVWVYVKKERVLGEEKWRTNLGGK